MNSTILLQAGDSSVFVAELGLGVSLFYAPGKNCIKDVRDSP